MVQMYYHIGKISKVFQSKRMDLALVDTWDEGKVIAIVETPGIKLKKDDVVILGYCPITSTPASEISVIKKLEDDEGKDAWEEMKAHYKKLIERTMGHTPPPPSGGYR